MKNKNRVSTIPIAMATKKFFCHKCGAKLETKAKYRTLKRGDPDYNKHSGMLHMHAVGDIELTEYDFICPSCNSVTVFGEQRVIARIQKHLGKNKLSQSEIDAHFEKASSELEKKQRSTDIFVNTLTVAVIILVVWYFFCN